MSKFVTAVRRTLIGVHVETPVHFHQGTTEDYPEVCYEGACERPRLHVSP
jgi:hypothetical protein